MILQVFQPMWSRYLSVTDGQTDRRTDDILSHNSFRPARRSDRGGSQAKQFCRLKPCPHCRRKVRLLPKTARQRRNSATVALFCDSLTFLRQLLFSATNYRTFLRQSHFSATVAVFGDKLSHFSATMWKDFNIAVFRALSKYFFHQRWLNAPPLQKWSVYAYCSMYPYISVSFICGERRGCRAADR